MPKNRCLSLEEGEVRVLRIILREWAQLIGEKTTQSTAVGIKQYVEAGALVDKLDLFLRTIEDREIERNPIEITDKGIIYKKLGEDNEPDDSNKN